MAMNPSAFFIRRPVATTLLTVAIGLVGLLAMSRLAVAPLPQIEFPAIQVNAVLPGGSPETLASTVATPLERQFGRIAGITEMSSTSTLGGTSVVLQFDLDRDIDAASRDVQAAINAARSFLPPNLPTLPNYRKVNPADSPVIILALSSDLYPMSEVYNVASSILQQRLSQTPGVGQVMIGGSSLPGIRIEVDPAYLNNYGLGLEDIRRVIQGQNIRRPVGVIENHDLTWILKPMDQLLKVEEYQNLIIRTAKGQTLRLGDLAHITQAAEDARAIGFMGDQPCVILLVNRQPGANIIDAADRVIAMMPELQASIPAGMTLTKVIDRTLTIRASVHDIELSLVVSILLVVFVVYLFLGNLKTTLIPVIAIPVSILGTYGVMFALDYSLNNLTLMALTIATGFVVDDAIVVTENITRHLERGLSPRAAAIRGSKEIGFTILSISISLVAVFLPLLLMEGMLGRLFREFSVTLASAVLISMVISLVTTPMLCSVFLRHEPEDKALRGRFSLWTEAFQSRIESGYGRGIRWVVEHQFLMLILTSLTVFATGYLYKTIPKGFFPQQDTGRLMGQVIADQQTSYQAMVGRLHEYIRIMGEDPAIQVVVGFAGGSGPGGGGSAVNTARVFGALKPLSDRGVNADAVIGRLRSKMLQVPGGQLFLQPPQDLRIGGKISATQWQYTLKASTLDDLRDWSPKVLEALRSIPAITDLNMDHQNAGLSAVVEIDRETAMRLGVSVQAIDDALYDAFGQRQVSTLYGRLNQAHVVMGVPLNAAERAGALDHLYVASRSGKAVPLRQLAHFRMENIPLQVNHSEQFPSTTYSFNLIPGYSLSDAIKDIQTVEARIGLPDGVKGKFQGAALAFQSSLKSQPFLVLAALISVYIVLGMLYENTLHPITILSTIPSAGVGALLGLMLFKIELNVIGLIGIILLIGIVKKNAIMMIDFALHLEQHEGLDPKEAIIRACLLRFRPIMMTTLAAIFGAIPLAFGRGPGFEIRQPLGISIIGGLLLSQLITLYSTPVVYLAMERFRLKMAQWRLAFSSR
jgi:multidrug efflux pump